MNENLLNAETIAPFIRPGQLYAVRLHRPKAKRIWLAGFYKRQSHDSPRKIRLIPSGFAVSFDQFVAINFCGQFEQKRIDLGIFHGVFEILGTLDRDPRDFIFGSPQLVTDHDLKSVLHITSPTGDEALISFRRKDLTDLEKLLPTQFVEAA